VEEKQKQHHSSTRRKRGETAELIISAAEKIIEEKGFEEFRLQDIADAIGIKQPSIYNHYAGRQAILSELSLKAVNGQLNLFDSDDAIDDPFAELVAGSKRLISFLASHIVYVRLLLLDLSSPTGLPEFNAVLGEPGELEKKTLGPMLEQLDRILVKGRKNGTLRGVNTTDFYHLIYGTSLVQLALTRPFPNPCDSPMEYVEVVQNLQAEIEELVLRPLLISNPA